MRFRVLNGKIVEIVTNERILEMFEKSSGIEKTRNGVLYVSSREYQKKKLQLEKIEPKERLTPKRIAEDIYRDVIHIEKRYCTMWEELSLRNIEDY